MSRSYKKIPIVKDNKKGRKFAKRQSNKKVRNYMKRKDLANGKSYRKVYNPWDIYDWITYCNLSEYLFYEDDDISYDESYKDWYIRFKRK